MAKYELLRRAISQLPHLSECIQLSVPPAASFEEISKVHETGYVNALREGKLDPQMERRIGFPFSPELLERSRRSVGGTLAACRKAIDEGIALNLAGGTHHSFFDRGEGFCVLNDSVVALKKLQEEGLVRKAIVIDTDVHQGNGTASLLAEDESIFTFSIHGAKNYPFKKEKSDLDVELPDETGDSEYLEALHGALRTLRDIEVDFCIFLSGADPYEEDRLGRLSVSKKGLQKRDSMVLEWCHQKDLKVAVTMGGGYAPELNDIVEIHLQTVSEAYRFYQAYQEKKPF